jgi:Ran GTPase-activating protein (RanGAP) involved in mRNA processing and transport
VEHNLYHLLSSTLSSRLLVISHIDLSNNSIKEKGAKYIADALKTNHSLKNLSNIFLADLWDNGLGTDGCKYIAESLRKNKTLIYLSQINIDIGSNDIKSLGAQYIAQAMLCNGSLKSLSIFAHYI